MTSLREMTEVNQRDEAILMQGGGKAGQERQRQLGRLPVRERLSALLDQDRPFLELGLWAAYKMYPEWETFLRRESLRASVGFMVAHVVSQPTMRRLRQDRCSLSR